MPRSAPEDDMMDEQQAKDLGHATKSQPRKAKDAEKETSEAHIESNTRANRGLGELIPPDRESETESAIKRAAYPKKR
ncbi:hypothetical protein [Chelativorans sp. YIM 93263]|uniref:hypothetical protein n=1 Tax=Chelativorans sp. YIM 93263 TaxID=2906648 RepID=UPI002377F730|nr:hypothetical protein [Chelativorans sp. YIM 93263]